MSQEGGARDLDDYLQRVAAVVDTPDAWDALYAVLEEAHADGDLAFLAGLAARLLAPPAALDPETATHVLDLAVGALALVPGLAAVEALLALARDPALLAPVPHQLPDAGARLLGARLAQAQEEEVLAAALDRHGARAELREVFACWIQERVARGFDLDGVAAVARWWGELRAGGHPLAALPLHPLLIEQNVPARAASFDVLSSSGWGNALPHEPAPEPASPLPPPVATEVADPAWIARVEQAYAISAAVSNGRSETRLFRLDPPVAPEQLTGAFLRALPLAALEGAEGMEVWRLGPEQAYAGLLWVAAEGGAYNLAWSGAWGRLGAFRALGALVGADAGASLEAIEAQARASTFVYARVEAPWFHRVVHDFFLAVSPPGGRTLMVTAWTDTD
jgi:hypothetical protein